MKNPIVLAVLAIALATTAPTAFAQDATAPEITINTRTGRQEQFKQATRLRMNALCEGVHEMHSKGAAMGLNLKQRTALATDNAAEKLAERKENAAEKLAERKGRLSTNMASKRTQLRDRLSEAGQAMKQRRNGAEAPSQNAE